MNKTIEKFDITDSLSVNMSDCSTKQNEYFSFDFVDNDNGESYETYMSREKLRGLAVFILNFLENN